jgi:hypothetical protein
VKVGLRRLRLGESDVAFGSAWLQTETNGLLTSWNGHVHGSDASGRLLDAGELELNAIAIDGRTITGRVLVTRYQPMTGDQHLQGTRPLTLD